MKQRSILLFAAMCVIWGIPYLLIRVAVAEVAPAVLVFARTSIGALVLVPVVIARGGLRGLGRKWWPLLAFAAAEIGIPWLLLSRAEQHISSSLAGILISAVPLLGVLVAPLFGRRERIGPLAITGLLVGMGGVALIVGVDFQSSDVGALLEVAVVALGYAVGPAILARYMKEVSSVTVTGLSLGACAIAYAPVAAFTWPAALPSAGALAAIGILGLVCTALAFLLFFELIREIGPVRSTVITYVNPAVAALLGVLVLHETFTAAMGAGFALVLAGSVLATRRPKAARTG